MKITFLVMRFPPKWLAGTEIATYNTAKYMGENNEVSVVTSHDAGLTDRSRMDGFDVYRVPRYGLRFFGFLFFWFKMFLTIKKIKPDIIQVQGLHMAVPAVLAKKILGVPYVISGQGSDVYTSWPFKKTISKRGLKNTDTLIALTENMKETMQKFFNKKIEVVPNGIDTERFNLNKRESCEKLGLDHEQKIIIFIGRLEPVKGLKYLIEAISILKTDLNLVVVGDGSEKHSLKLLVNDLKLEDKVIFTGKISNEKIPEYLTASDVFVLPSLSEGFPVVLLEAMAAGLPIVTTRKGGLPEIIEDKVNGFLVNPGSPEELADKINLVLKDEKLAEKISRVNKEKSKTYNLKNIVLRLGSLYTLNLT